MLQKLGFIKNGSIFVTPTVTMTIVNPNIIIGQNIRTLREKMGLTQEALAQYLDIKREAIAYYEIGQRSIPSAQLSKLANLFCMNEYDFYEEDLQSRSIYISFVFKADELQPQDMESIAKFKKIVRNYISMKKAMGNV